MLIFKACFYSTEELLWVQHKHVANNLFSAKFKFLIVNDRFIAAVLYGYCSEYERINRNSMLSYRTINYQNQLVTFHFIIQGKQFSLLLRLVSLEHIPSTEILCIFVLLLKLAVSCHLMGQNIDSVTQHHPQQIVTYISLLTNATFPVG